MNNEQLQKGIELKGKIEKANTKQTELINNYKARIKSGIYLSFDGTGTVLQYMVELLILPMYICHKVLGSLRKIKY